MARSTIGCSDDDGPPAAITGASRPSISAAARAGRHLGLDDHGGGVREHVHQRLVALGELLVRGEPAAQKVPYSVPSLRVTGTET